MPRYVCSGLPGRRVLQMRERLQSVGVGCQLGGGNFRRGRPPGYSKNRDFGGRGGRPFPTPPLRTLVAVKTKERLQSVGMWLWLDVGVGGGDGGWGDLDRVGWLCRKHANAERMELLLT